MFLYISIPFFIEKNTFDEIKTQQGQTDKLHLQDQGNLHVHCIYNVYKHVLICKNSSTLKLELHIFPSTLRCTRTLVC